MAKNESKSIDATFKVEDFEPYIGIILGVSTILLVFLYFEIWDISSFIPFITFKHAFVLLLLVIAGIIMHELIHAFFLLIVSKGKASLIKFGWNLKQGMFYVAYSETLKINMYRFIIIAPALFLGLIPITISYMYNLPLLFIWSIIMLVISIGDFLILWTIKGFPSNAYAKDHPEKIGCEIHFRVILNEE